jgi:hypothetical protein
MLVFTKLVFTMLAVCGPVHAYTLPVPPTTLPVRVMAEPAQTGVEADGVNDAGSWFTVIDAVLLATTLVLQVVAVTAMFVIVTVVAPAFARVDVVNTPNPVPPMVIVAVLPTAVLAPLRLYVIV